MLYPLSYGRVPNITPYPSVTCVVFSTRFLLFSLALAGHRGPEFQGIGAVSGYIGVGIGPPGFRGTGRIAGVGGGPQLDGGSTGGSGGNGEAPAGVVSRRGPSEGRGWGVGRKKRWAIAGLGLAGFALAGLEWALGWPVGGVGLAVALGATAWGVSEMRG
jgi:hypothetical protein